MTLVFDLTARSIAARTSGSSQELMPFGPMNTAMDRLAVIPFSISGCHVSPGRSLHLSNQTDNPSSLSAVAIASTDVRSKLL